MALRIVVRQVQIKAAGGGYRHQRVEVVTTDYHGQKVRRECNIPVEPHAEPYEIGVYELSDRSYYVDRNKQQLMLMPRLRRLRDLKSVSVGLAEEPGVQAVA